MGRHRNSRYGGLRRCCARIPTGDTTQLVFDDENDYTLCSARLICALCTRPATPATISSVIRRRILNVVFDQPRSLSTIVVVVVGGGGG